MRINQINYINTFKPKNIEPMAVQTPSTQKSNLPMPNYAHYLSFCGGSSLNLKESVKNLDAISTTSGEKFPPDIYQHALSEIQSGNPNSKTLIDIHKEKYSFLNSCYDLEDVKSYFPEFKDVLSDDEVDFRHGSFAEKAKNGELENFNQDEDLAFQLLKMYWAEGFSLTDLKKENDVDLYHTMKKYNIPLLDKDYAHVLKFSDKEYNERLTQKMTQSRMEARDRRELEKSGEPIYIPRGPLSEMHKKHISEGLLKHYAEHPEKLAIMSERQTEYFKAHPEQAEMMSKALTFAWKTQEGRTIQTRLIKFFKKEGAKIDSKELDAIILDPKQNRNAQILTKFWKINGWAKEQFSIALTKGWQKAKETKENEKINPEVKFDTPDTNEIIISYQQALIPDQYLENIEKWAKENNIFNHKVDFEKIRTFKPHKSNHDNFLKLESMYNKGTNRKNGPKVLRMSAKEVLLRMRKDMLQNPSSEMEENELFYEIINKFIEKETGKEKFNPEDLTPEMAFAVLGEGLIVANSVGYDGYLNLVHKYSNQVFADQINDITNHMLQKNTNFNKKHPWS